METVLAVIGAVLGSGLIQFFVTRHDSKKENSMEKKLDKILAEQKKTEKDNLRTQLLVMMNMMPNNHEEIMTLAQRYFYELKGDWFYSSLFMKWLKDNDIEKPIWFNEGKAEN